MIEIFCFVSSKLFLYFGVKWCWYVYEVCMKFKKIVIFGDFVKFVKEEVELVNDFIFLLSVLKVERKKLDILFRMGWWIRLSKGDNSLSVSVFVVLFM